MPVWAATGNSNQATAIRERKGELLANKTASAQKDNIVMKHRHFLTTGLLWSVFRWLAASRAMPLTSISFLAGAARTVLRFRLLHFYRWFRFCQQVITDRHRRYRATYIGLDIE